MPAARPLTVVTYNIHKGLSQFNRRLVLHDIRERLKSLEADVVFLQEVQGLHATYARLYRAWPEADADRYYVVTDAYHAAAIKALQGR